MEVDAFLLGTLGAELVQEGPRREEPKDIYKSSWRSRERRERATVRSRTVGVIAGFLESVDKADPSSLLQLTCAQGSTGLRLWWSLLALSLTRVTRTSGIAFSVAFHDCSS